MHKKIITKSMIIITLILCFNLSVSAQETTMYRKSSRVVKGEWVKTDYLSSWDNSPIMEYRLERDDGEIEYISERYAKAWLSKPQEISIETPYEQYEARKWGYRTINEFSEDEKTTLYAGDRTMVVPYFLVNTYLKLGWCESVVKLYALDGRELFVSENSKEEYLNLGWYENPVIVLYTLDGREEVFLVEEAEAQCSVGWYREKPVLLYTIDGRRQYFPANEVDAQCSVGWYTKSPVTLYTLDGRSQAFPVEKVAEQRTVGWYYLSEIEKMNKLKELAKSFYIGQKVWKKEGNYYVIGNVVGIDGGTISVWWDRFKDWDWYGVYNQSDILIAERMTHINLGTIYTYNADEINPYK